MTTAGEQTASAKVNKAIQRIRRFYEIGKKSLRKRPGRSRYRKDDAQREADDVPMNVDLLRKARQFADPTDGYSAKEVDQLCELCIKHGHPLRRSHILRLLTVPKKARAK